MKERLRVSAIIATSVALLLPFSCISRLARPALTGKIVDYQGRPVAGCMVGETLTDSLGHFALPEIRYRVFVIPEIFYMEAPPLHVVLDIQKEGFEKDGIEIHHPWGGGGSKGTTWELGNCYLQRIDESVDIRSVLQDAWLLSATRNQDTLFIVNKHQLESSHQTYRRFSLFCMRKYYRYAENYSDAFIRLPDSLQRKAIVSRDNAPGTLKTMYYSHPTKGIVALNYSENGQSVN